jgi:hypothetical protein
MALVANGDDQGAATVALGDGCGWREGRRGAGERDERGEVNGATIPY